MNTTFAPLHSSSSRVLLVPCLALALSLDSASAQQAPNYAPPAGYQQQPGYGSYQTQRPGVSQRVGGFVKRLFYGERQSSYAPPQPQYGSSSQPGRSLDAPPSSYRQTAPTTRQSVTSMPPAPAKKSSTSSATSSKPKTTTAPKSTSAPTKSSTSKYTPPRIKPEAPAPKIEPKPEPKKIEEQPPAPKTEPTPPPTPAPTPTYTAPAKEDPPPALNNQPSNAPTTLAGLNSTLPGTDSKPSEPAPTETKTETTPKQTPASTTEAGQFLIGKKTATPGRVISPYPPYQELDVSGLSSGSLALDPTTDKVFQIP